MASRCGGAARAGWRGMRRLAHALIRVCIPPSRASQRPLEVIYKDAGGSPFVPLGVDIAALDRAKKWHFRPCNFREGQTISGGSIFGEVCRSRARAAAPRPPPPPPHTHTCAQVYENELVPVHSIMCPPEMFGTVVAVYGAGGDGHEMFNLEVRAACVCVCVWGGGTCRAWRRTRCLRLKMATRASGRS